MELSTENEVREAIVAIGRMLYDRGFIAGGDGNISARLSDGSILTTPTMVCKGRLSPDEGKAAKVHADIKGWVDVREDTTLTARADAKLSESPLVAGQRAVDWQLGLDMRPTELWKVPRLPPRELRPDAPPGETSAQVRVRVEQARAIQLARAGRLNAQLGQAETLMLCRLDDAHQALLEHAIDRLRLSARSMQRVLRVARTIADLAGAERIDRSHLTEALGYRRIDRGKP
jgi:hypothetical protein